MLKKRIEENQRIIILLLLLLSIHFHTISITKSQPKKTIVSSSGIILCSSVKGYGRYTPKENLLVKVGERVYFYNQIKVKTTKIGGVYKIHITWILTIYNPLGMLEHNSSTSTGLKNVGREEVEWCAWFSWRPYKNELEGNYKVVLKILDELSGDKLTHEINFSLVGGIPRTLKYHLNITLTLFNKFGKSGSVTKLFVMTIPTVKPYQEVMWGPSFNIKPSKFITDPYGCLLYTSPSPRDRG